MHQKLKILTFTLTKKVLPLSSYLIPTILKRLIHLLVIPLLVENYYSKLLPKIPNPKQWN